MPSQGRAAPIPVGRRQPRAARPGARLPRVAGHDDVAETAGPDPAAGHPEAELDDAGDRRAAPPDPSRRGRAQRRDHHQRRPAEASEAEDVLGPNVSQFAEDLGPEDVAMGRGLHHALHTPSPSPLLDQPHQPDSLQLSDVVIEALARDPEASGQAAGRGGLA